VAEFSDTDELRAARFTGVDLSGARFRSVDLTGVKMVDAVLVNADLSGLIDGLTVNGIEVAPLIAREMDRRYPERAKLFAADPEGLRAAWSAIETLWDTTLARAHALPEEKLHERVDEEWSFVETLRHLVFATDAWIFRVVFGEAKPYHPLGLPPTFTGDCRDLGIDVSLDPSLDEVLEVRRERMRRVRELVDRVTPAELERVAARNEAHGYPPDTEHPVLRCIWTVIDEEWAHNLFANRDLDRLGAPGAIHQ
jgi:hypothetical protein